MSEVPLYDQTEGRLLLSNQAPLTGGAGTREVNRTKLEAFIDTITAALHSPIGRLGLRETARKIGLLPWHTSPCCPRLHSIRGTWVPARTSLRALSLNFPRSRSVINKRCFPPPPASVPLEMTITGVTRDKGHTPPPGWWYAAGHSASAQGYLAHKKTPTPLGPP